jgi:uncharacterized protein (TIGR02246 family)
MKARFAACLMMVLVQGCDSRESQLPPQVTRAFEQTFAGKDPAATAALFTDDAQILMQEQPAVKGRHDIEQFLAEQMNPILLFDQTTDMSLVRGDLALETGSYTFRDSRRGDNLENGKYMYVWRRVGQHWKLYRAMFNTDAPTQAEVTVSGVDE